MENGISSWSASHTHVVDHVDPDRANQLNVLYVHIYRTFVSIHYWIGTGQVMKCDLFHSRSHRKFYFRPVNYGL